MKDNHTAKLLKAQLPDWQGFAGLYKLDPPYTEDKLVAEYVVVSTVDNMFASETLIFPSDENGTVDNWLEITGLRNCLNHAHVLGMIGYMIV